MSLLRRQFLHLAAGTAALPALSVVAKVQSYPVRPVHIVVGYPPGGVVDILARLVGQRLSERFGRPFIVDNRPGAAANVATEAVVHARADGYTLLMFGLATAINATLYENLSFNFIHDIAPVAGLVRAPNVMEVNPAFPAQTVPEFIAYAKTHGGAINMASGGIGTPAHVSGELFKMMTGIEMIHVPYRGQAPALTDLLGGRVQVDFDAIPSSIGYIRAGKLRALAVTTAMRSEALPDVPSVGEFVPGYEASAWYGIGVPKRTPTEIIEKLNTEVDAILADASMKAQLAELGGVPMPMSPDGLEKLIVSETAKWGQVIRTAKIKAE